MTPKEDLVADACHAILTSDVEKLCRAIEQGVDINARDHQYPQAWRFFRAELNGASLLHEAVVYSSKMFFTSDLQPGRPNEIEIIRMLIDAGASVLSQNHKGFMPLHNAAIVDHDLACQLLIDQGAPVNAQSLDGYTPLHSAVYRGSMNATSVLIRNGANIHLKNVEGLTPYDYAGEHNQQEAKVLLEAQNARERIQSILRPENSLANFSRR